VQEVIDIKDIDPSPYQRRRYFDEDKLKELAASIQREGLIEPIVVRPIRKRYELIAGERRLRAIRDYTEMQAIQAQIVHVDNLQARRISAAENMQREDLSAIEAIEAIVEIVDAELIEDSEYSSMDKTAMDRVKTLLGKLDSVRRSEALGYEVAARAKFTSHKFVGSVEKIFRSLPKPLEWRSFYNHDLPLLMDFCEEVREISIKHHLNKSQTRALEKLKEASEEEFQKIVGQDQTPLNQAWAGVATGGEIDKDPCKITIRDVSAREIEEIANKAANKEIMHERNRPRISPSLNLKVKIFLLSRLGIPIHRVVPRLKINRKTVLKYYDNPDLVQSIRYFLGEGLSVPEIAEEHWYPEPLVWSIAFEGKTDQERFESLNWGLRTWDLWNWNDCDKRFGDDWPARHRSRPGVRSGEAGGPGRIPAQMIAHILYYFSDQNDLVFDPMAGGGVAADTCLAFNRKCWSFDMDDRPDTRPEIEPYFWDITNLKWPIKGKTKPDLIIFDPPYFKKQSNNYDPDGISGMSKANYLEFLENFFALVHLNAKKSTQMAFINADWPARHREPDRHHKALAEAFAQAKRAGAISKTPLPKMRPG